MAAPATDPAEPRRERLPGESGARDCRRARRVDESAELGGVPTPRQGGENRQCRGRETAAVLAGREHGLGNDLHVFPALPQRRHLDRERKPPQQLLAQPAIEPILDGGYHAHVQHHRRDAPRHADLSVAEQPRQAPLQRRGHLGEAGEEQRAARGASERTRLGNAFGVRRPGRLRSTNQLFLERRRRGAVARQHHERLRTPPAPAVDGAGHGFRVEAGFGRNQHAAVVARGARQLSHGVGHGR